MQREQHAFPPRLLRLVELLQAYPELDIDLIPVTVLWGRAPENEDSWLKLLFTDNWAPPSRLKQLLNIGLHGRETFLEFHPVESLRSLIDYANATYPNLSPVTYIVNHLNNFLDAQRKVVLGIRFIRSS